MNNHYELLGVSRTASLAEIKKQYRILAKKYHPDRNPNNEEAAENFRKIQEAYEILSDEKRRKEFDALLTQTDGAVTEANEIINKPETKADLKKFFAAVTIVLGVIVLVLTLFNSSGDKNSLS